MPYGSWVDEVPTCQIRATQLDRLYGRCSYISYHTKSEGFKSKVELPKCS